MSAISEGNWTGREPGSEGTFYCPRRDEMAAWLGKTDVIFLPEREGTDVYQSRRGELPGCSYCGSISPADYFRIIEEGGEHGPTDKGYKAYVHERGDGKCSYCKGTGKLYPFGGDPTVTADERAYEQKCEFCRGTGESASGPQHKFYFHHFTQDDRDRFIAMHNDGKIRYGYPGYLYSGVYFARRAPKDGSNV